MIRGKITFFVSFLMLLLLVSYVQSAEIRPTDDVNAIRDAIMNANDGDVIILERGKVYYFQATIDVNNSITIKADEATTGPKPIVAFLVKEDGTVDKKAMSVRADFTCHNIHFHGGISGFAEKDIGRAFVWNDTPEMRAVFENCWFEDFDQRTCQLEAPDMRFFATNCVWCDDHKTEGPSEGRSIDCRQYGPDTLFVQNCSFINVGDRWIRHLPSSGRLDPINYAVIDHCTFVIGANYRSAFTFGRIENLQFTNNIVYNPGILGSDFMRRPSKNDGQLLLADPADYYSPDKAVAPHRLREVFYDREEGIRVFGCFGVDSTDTEIVMHHNNCYMDEAIINKIAENDTLHPQEWMCSQFENSIVDDPENPFDTEELAFVDVPELPLYIIDDYVGYWDQNQYLTMHRTAPDSVDLSYGTSAASYTAAEGGFPLGDLNWYPDKKAEWQTWLTGVDNKSAVKPLDFALSQNYPNPFNPTTTIAYTLQKATDVTLTVYNMMGRKVKTLVSERIGAGANSVQWDGTDAAGQKVMSGIYFYKLETENMSQTKKMLLVE